MSLALPWLSCIVDTRPTEICRMSSEAGFRTVELLGSTGGEPYQLGSPPVDFGARAQNVNLNEPCITLAARVEMTVPKRAFVWAPAGSNLAAVLMLAY
jgi:hypothetical protein